MAGWCPTPAYQSTQRTSYSTMDGAALRRGLRPSVLFLVDQPFSTSMPWHVGVL